MFASGQFRSGSFGVTELQRTLVRGFCVAVAVSQAIGGFGLFRQFDWAINGWPLPDVRMTYIFLASIAAAIGAPCAWIAWRKEFRALRPMGFELMLGLPAVAGYLLWLAADRGDGRLVLLGLAALIFGAVMAGLYWWSGHVPLVDARRLPGVIRIALAALCAVLVVLGIALTFQVGNVFPWTVTPEMSTVIGLIFLSAALLFGWIVVHPAWAFGEMALTSFLSYALVLAGPYLDLWRNRNDVATVASYYGEPGIAGAAIDNGINERSLLVYLLVLAFGAGLAIWVFAWGRIRQPAAPGTSSLGEP
jgi:hypothetical protein